MENTQTFGQKAVGLRFNPSENPQVAKIKNLYAEIIDLNNSLRANEESVAKTGGIVSREKIRLFSVAITEAQTSQMWAVKAITWED